MTENQFQSPTREQIAEAIEQDERVQAWYAIWAYVRQHHPQPLTDERTALSYVLALFQQPTPGQECAAHVVDPASNTRGMCPVCWPGSGEHGQQPTPSADPMAPGTKFTYPTRWEVCGRGGLTGRVIAEMVEENTTRYLDDLDPSTIRDVTPPPATPEADR